MSEVNKSTDVLGQSRIFTREVINDIHVKSELGRYRMRGFSIFKKIPHWDELVFLPGTLTRFVIEGYREKCETKDCARVSFRGQAFGARHSCVHHRHEFRCFVAGGQNGFGEGCLDGRHRYLFRRGWHDPT